MDENEVRPTWRLAWGLWWRMLLISLGMGLIIGAILAILALVGITFILPLPW
jgi:Mg/Co/Ni transporter MgtE